MKRRPLKLSFAMENTPERRIVSLEQDGVLCIPVLGFDNYKRQWRQAPVHIHEECLEITLCLRGDLEMETPQGLIPVRPGSVFVTRPDEPHRLRDYPKGMSKYWVLFRIPKGNFPLLRLPVRERKWLLGRLTTLHNRLFEGGKTVLPLFQRLFRLYDTLPLKTPERAFRLRSAVTDLLLAVVEASESAPRIRPDERLRYVMERMMREPGLDYPLERLVEQTALSPTNLLTRFKKLTGLPPHAFLLSCRMARAKEELAKGVESIAALSDALGFATPRHFAAQFKSATGFSPREWMKHAGGVKT